MCVIVGVCFEGIGSQDPIPKPVLTGYEAKTPLAEVCGCSVDLYRIEFASPDSALAASFPDGVEKVASSGHGIENAFRTV